MSRQSLRSLLASLALMAAPPAAAGSGAGALDVATAVSPPGCKKDELALTHSATDGLSTIAAGIDLQAGDEVVMTDLEHPSGKAGWAVRAARHGIAVREVKLPVPPASAGQLADVRLYGALVTIGFRGAKLDDLWRRARERRIWILGAERLRLSTHVHTRPEDLEAFYALADEVIGGRRR